MTARNMEPWIVVLLGHRNPYDGEGALRVVYVDPEEAAAKGLQTAELAVRQAHEKPPSTTQVRHAWAHRLADPYNPTLVPADVPSPEWGEGRAAR